MCNFACPASGGDDITMTHTKSNDIQYNVYPPKRQRRGEYYPFGMQTANSWTRENATGNNFLAKADPVGGKYDYKEKINSGFGGAYYAGFYY